jgi:hypothetical protein
MERRGGRRKEANIGRAFVLITIGDDMMGFKVNISSGEEEVVSL